MSSGVVANGLRLVTCRMRRAVAIVAVAGAALVGTVSPARALDRLCDPSYEDCRAILLNYIRNETVGIDVGFWFMEDARYTAELSRRLQAGVRVRVIMDLRANDINVHNPQRLA